MDQDSQNYKPMNPPPLSEYQVLDRIYNILWYIYVIVSIIFILKGGYEIYNIIFRRMINPLFVMAVIIAVVAHLVSKSVVCFGGKCPENIEMYSKILSIGIYFLSLFTPKMLYLHF
jgi:hypothetical protein